MKKLIAKFERERQQIISDIETYSDKSWERKFQIMKIDGLEGKKILLDWVIASLKTLKCDCK